MVLGEATCSVAAVAKANCLRIGLALGNDFFNATVKRLALLLHSAEAKSDCCQGNSREDSGRDLNHAIGKHRISSCHRSLCSRASWFLRWQVSSDIGKGNNCVNPMDRKCSMEADSSRDNRPAVQTMIKDWERKSAYSGSSKTERVGFEPTRVLPLHDFESCAFNRALPPLQTLIQR